MGSRSATKLLQLPVQLHGIRLGRPVDLLLDPESWRALGFVVLCRDDVERFLVFAGATCMRTRSRCRRPSCYSRMSNLLLRPDGSIEGLVGDEDDSLYEAEPGGARVESEHVSTA